MFHLFLVLFEIFEIWSLLSINVRYKVVNIETRNWKHEEKWISPALDHRFSGWRGSESTTIWNTWSFPEWATPSSFHVINLLLLFSVSTSGSPQRELTEISYPLTAQQKGMPSAEPFVLVTTKDNHCAETFASCQHPLLVSSSLIITSGWGKVKPKATNPNQNKNPETFLKEKRKKLRKVDSEYTLILYSIQILKSDDFEGH